MVLNVIVLTVKCSLKGAIQTKAARFCRRVLSVPEHSHLSRKTLDAVGILVPWYANMWSCADNHNIIFDTRFSLDVAHGSSQACNLAAAFRVFFRPRTSRCVQNLVRQRAPFKCMGFWYIRSRISATEKTRVFGVNSPWGPIHRRAFFPQPKNTRVFGVNWPSGPIQTKDARFFRRVLSVPEHSHLSRKTLDAARILVLL